MWQRAVGSVAAAIAVAACAGSANAQTAANGNADDVEWSPAVYSWVLRKAGDEELDPFGASGRREVLQLLAPGRTLHGTFQRIRLDRLERGEPSREGGWYEIRGGLILLYHADGDGATGRVETGRYLHGRICFVDPDDGRVLAYEFLAPAIEGVDVRPPRSPGAPDAGECDAPRS